MKIPPRRVSKKCRKCGLIKEMAVTQFWCLECFSKDCIICKRHFYSPPSEFLKRQCCSVQCKNILQKSKKFTPLQKLRHKHVMENYFLKGRVEGLRMCTKCKIQKEETEFCHQKSEFKNTGRCLNCKNESDRVYKQKNRDVFLKKYQEKMRNPGERKKARERNKFAVSKRRFNLNRYEIILDNTECENCGMTQTQHLQRHNHSLHIHHKDGRGRIVQDMGGNPNNDINNLAILCTSCHQRETMKTRDYSGNGYKIWETRRKNMMSKNLCRK
jgi:hypothetical protein